MDAQMEHYFQAAPKDNTVAASSQKEQIKSDNVDICPVLKID